ncbi:MAG: ABC transporter substrate-binding protein [Xanthobacteraceae bacterium]
MAPAPFASQRMVTALAATLVLSAASSLAQTNPVAEIAAYQGSDREQRLLDGAKREKELTVYASIPSEEITVLAAAFDKKYGLKVKVWRADSESILQRILAEARGRRFEFDIAAAASSALEPLAREQMLVEVNSPLFGDLVPEGLAPHRQWVAIYLNTIVQAYNTNLISKDRLPQTYHDLLRPEWRGNLGIEAEDFDWFAQVVLDLGEAQGLKLFRDIVSSNGISVRKGHSLLANLVSAGEVPLALTVYGFLAEQAKTKGAPLDWFAIAPLIARPTAQGLARNALHPHAALLFYDFLIGEAQQILASRQFVVASRKIDTPAKAPVKLIDSALMLDQGRKWQDLYQRTILGRSR